MHELIQSEIQSDIISEKSLLLPAEVFRFRSVPFREIYPTVIQHAARFILLARCVTSYV